MAQPSGYFSEDTIAALSAPTGGAIAIVRVSGPLSKTILQRLTRSHKEFQPRKVYRCRLHSEENEVLDDAMAILFENPQSYTGEDLVEYHIHGNGFIAHRVLETLVHLGARQALPGEFSFRAVKNGKMNLFQAQAVADLIAASNPGAVSLALDKMDGAQSQIMVDLAHSLRQITALSELGIDFSDQDVDEVSLPRLKGQLEPIIQSLEHLRNSYSRGVRLQEGIRVALVGLPNAGKSSYFNALLGEDRSIVSHIAGTTRDVVREKFTLRGKKATLTLRLEDTAGLRSTEDLIEKIGIQRTHDTVKNAELILFIVDPSSSHQALQEQWESLRFDALEPLEKRTIGIITKADQFSNEVLERCHSLIQGFGISSISSVSSTTGTGLKESIDTLVSFCESMVQRQAGELLLTRIDHLSAVTQTLGHLEQAMRVQETDLFASDLRQALHTLSPLIGVTPTDDILGKIFSEFCIGK